MFSPLRIPLTKTEYAHNRIDSAKGYVYADGTHTGWYVPPVHNTVKFSGLHDLVVSLATKKAGSSLHRRTYRSVSMFETFDFVESSDQSDAVELRGPVPAGAGIDDGGWYTKAAEWLCSMQKEDGTIPAVIDVRTNQQRTDMDWVRLTLAALSLALFGKKDTHTRSLVAAERAWKYIESLDVLSHLSREPDYLLTLTYVYELARALGHDDKAGVVIGRLYDGYLKQGKRWLGVLPMSHIARALSSSHVGEQRLEGERIATLLRERYKKTDEHSFAPVLWAEAVTLFWERDRALAYSIADKICECAFPDERNGDSKFAYTRGASKILEVLALDRARYAPYIHRLEQWLRTMQYTTESAFFVRADFIPSITGALRHDAFNWDVWSDSVAHCLIAKARTG